MVDEILKELVEFLQQVSPLVWTSFVRQVYAIAFSQIAWAVAILVICFIMWRFSNFCEKWQKTDDYYADEWVLRILSIFMPFISFGLIVSAVMRIYNPDYYAVMLILHQIK